MRNKRLYRLARLGHPRRKQRQCPIRLSNDEVFGPSMALRTNHHDRLTTSRVKRVGHPDLKCSDTRQYDAVLTGIGKSFIVCALGHKACRDDRTAEQRQRVSARTPLGRRRRSSRLLPLRCGYLSHLAHALLDVGTERPHLLQRGHRPPAGLQLEQACSACARLASVLARAASDTALIMASGRFGLSSPAVAAAIAASISPIWPVVASSRWWSAPTREGRQM
jgi:hypothetical protein